MSTSLGKLQTPVPIPELKVTPDHTQIFMFSAATWNRHHIHYSKDAAMAEGLPDVVVQRAFIGNLFARQLSEWMGDAGEIRELGWKVTQSAVPGCELTIRGTAVADEIRPAGREIDCELSMVDAQGRTIATGHARLGVAAGRST